MSELQEKLKKVQEYINQLNEELNGKKGKTGEPDIPSLEEQKKEIISQLAEGKLSANKGTKELRRLEARIKTINEFLERFKKISAVKTIQVALETLANGLDKNKKPLPKDQKQKLIKKISDEFKKANTPDVAPIAKLLGVDEKDLDLIKAKTDLEAEIASLKSTIATLEKRNISTKDLESEKAEKEATLEKIQKHLDSIIDEKALQNDLQKLANSKTKKAEKQAILDKYNSILDAQLKALIEELLTDLEKDANKKNKKGEVKNKLAQISEKTVQWVKEHAKAIGWTTGISVILILMLLMLNKCENTNNKTNNKPEGTKYPTSTSSTEANEKRVTIDALISKGYNEYFSTLMVENFSIEEVSKILNAPFIPMVENYAGVNKGFNLSYIEDYENARTIYNITSAKAVDYVNRAYQIQKSNFYDGASINDIVEILIAIDNKSLQTTDNVNLAQSFNTSFNRIVDNALFGATTKADLAKLDALNYFAAEGSDIEQFLSGFKPLCRKVLENPNDLAAKKDMYNYLNIFAASLNGFTNEESALNGKNEINMKAQVTDYNDWYITYNSFIAPMYPTFVPSAGSTPDPDIDNLIKAYEELQYLMFSALEGPELKNINGQGRILEN